jgi:excisionase family DNA binding protein
MSVIAKLRRNSLAAPRDVLAGIAEGLVRKIPALAPGTARVIAEALHDLLDGHDETSRNLRVGMQHYLIEIAELQRRPAQQHREPVLTTEAAAELMQCSRPYVAKLIDNGKLTGASVTEGRECPVPPYTHAQLLQTLALHRAESTVTHFADKWRDAGTLPEL